MSEVRGMIGGATPGERAVRLAGALAEMSQTRLVLHVGGAEVELQARVTNLPGVLVDEVTRRGGARVEAPALGAVFTLSAEGGTWACGDAHVAERLRAKLHG